MWLKNPLNFFLLITLANILAYAINIAISKLWDHNLGLRNTVTRQEIKNSLYVLVINITISLPGYLLWIKDYIQFYDINPVLSFVILFIVMDFLMYFMHYLSHKLPILKDIHAKHHEHTEEFNAVSLYYMSPWEAISFGLLMTWVVIIIPTHLFAFIAFLIFNWLYGVITHLNYAHKKPIFLIFTTNYFHQNHHQLFNKNYGFYTYLWDIIFRTQKLK